MIKISFKINEREAKTYVPGNPVILSTDFSAETIKARRESQNIFKVLQRKKPSNQEKSTWQDYYSELDEKEFPR